LCGAEPRSKKAPGAARESVRTARTAGCPVALGDGLAILAARHVHFDMLTHYIILGIGVLLALFAQARVKGAFHRWSQVRSRSGRTGAQVAVAILRAHGIHDVTVEPVGGHLSDHYDPSSKTLRLSEPVFQSDSVAALGVAAHEVGHAIQHAQGYAPLQFRSAWVPVASLGSNLSWIVLMIGFGLAFSGGSATVAWIGVGLFATTTLFTLVTLPVEFDASRRAMATLQQAGILVDDELAGARQVLNAAALTYVAAAISSLLELSYWVFHLLASQRREE
jgi:Zn-dependent membrane protease YugP